VPGYIPHSYVNDGVCDYEICCDGSDEWQGAGGVKCEDKCKEIGKEFRRLDEIRQKSTRAALKKKEELVKEAQRLRAGIEMSMTRLEAEIKAQEMKVEELKKKYEDVERRERGKVVTSKGKGSKVTVLAGLAKQRVEELREALVSVAGKRDALKEKVAQLEGILSTFKEEYNPNFNDEGVKRAVQAWENYAANKDPAGEDISAEDRDIEEISKPDTESEGINWAEYETEEESDVDARKVPTPHRHILAKALQSTNSKSIFPLPSVLGYTKNSPTCASCSSKMASWRTTPTRAPNPKPSPMHETPFNPSQMIWEASSPLLGTKRTISPKTTEQMTFSALSRIPASAKIPGNTPTSSAGSKRPARNLKGEVEILGWATSCVSISCG
jgi:predicted  nucleic acid-binding Zn-ribbon protein